METPENEDDSHLIIEVEDESPPIQRPRMGSILKTSSNLGVPISSRRASVRWDTSSNSSPSPSERLSSTSRASKEQLKSNSFQSKATSRRASFNPFAALLETNPLKPMSSETEFNANKITKRASYSDRLSLYDTASRISSHFDFDTLASRTSYWGFIKEYIAGMISYRTKSVLILLLISITHGLIIGMVFSLDDIIFSNHDAALLYKVLIVVIGLMANFLAGLVNTRHSELTNIHSILAESSSVSSLCEGINGHKRSSILKFTSLFFYCCLIAAELSIDSHPVSHYLGLGRVEEISDTVPTATDTDKETLYMSMGAQLACQSCHSKKSMNSLIIPISAHLQKVDHQGNVILSQPQDLIALDVSCFTLLKPNTTKPLRKFEVLTIGVSEGKQITAMELQISSLNTDNVKLTRMCLIVARDFRGLVTSYYSASPSGQTTLQEIKKIDPLDSFNCTKVGEICLNESRTTGMSRKLLGMIFGQSNVDANYDLGPVLKIFDIPSSNLTDQDYSLNFADSLALSLVVAAASMVKSSSACDLYTLDGAEQLQIGDFLFYMTVLASTLCVLESIILIIWDLLRLNRFPESLVLQVYKSIKLSPTFLERVSQCVTRIYQPGKKFANWSHIQLEFGESKVTKKQAFGRLGFDTKNRTIRFREDRKYY